MCIGESTINCEGKNEPESDRRITGAPADSGGMPTLGIWGEAPGAGERGIGERGYEETVPTLKYDSRWW